MQMNDLKKCKRCWQVMIGSGEICIKCFNELWDISENKQKKEEHITDKEKRYAPKAQEE